MTLLKLSSMSRRISVHQPFTQSSILVSLDSTQSRWNVVLTASISSGVAVEGRKESLCSKWDLKRMLVVAWKEEVSQLGSVDVSTA